MKRSPPTPARHSPSALIDQDGGSGIGDLVGQLGVLFGSGFELYDRRIDLGMSDGIHLCSKGEGMAFFSDHDPNDPALNPDDPAAKSAMQQVFGPGHVDHAIRQAIQFCWMGMPDERRNVDEVELQIRRLVDRALRDMRDDADAFGLGK